MQINVRSNKKCLCYVVTQQLIEYSRDRTEDQLQTDYIHIKTSNCDVHGFAAQKSI